MMASDINTGYGLSNRLFISRKANSDSFVFGGVAEDSSRWTRVITQRAAQTLWVQMAHYLQPDKTERGIMSAVTAPLRGADLPTITGHVTVDQSKDGSYVITGYAGNLTWSARCQQDEAQRFWDDLSKTLYPNGWQTQDKPRLSHP